MRGHEMRVARPKEEEAAEPEKRSYRKLREVRIERGDGGVMVHHHHTSNSLAYQEPPAPKLINSHEEFMEHMAGVSRKMGLSSGEKEAEATEGEENA